jgi:hypothetical protein
LDFSLFRLCQHSLIVILNHFIIMPPQGNAYNVDWIMSDSSDIHVANDRAWFTAYAPYRTKLAAMPGAEPSVEVHGIGTVVLPTRTYHEGKSHKPSSEITLHQVLYVPQNPVNIFATCREPDLHIQFGPEKVASITRRGSNKVLGLTVRSNLIKLWLKGQTQDQSSLDPNGLYYFHATWPDSEVAKFIDHVAQLRKQPSSAAYQTPPYTQEEHDFLAKHYGGEFKFLMTFGLKIHSEEDRDEGRSILRAMMAQSEDESKVYGQPARPRKQIRLA